MDPGGGPAVTVTGKGSVPMTLHRVAKTGPGGFDDLFTSPLSERPLPRRRIPDDQSDPGAVYSLISSELLLDGNAAQNLATFCTTWSEDEIHRLMDDCLKHATENAAASALATPKSVKPSTVKS